MASAGDNYSVENQSYIQECQHFNDWLFTLVSMVDCMQHCMVIVALSFNCELTGDFNCVELCTSLSFGNSLFRDETLTSQVLVAANI